MTRHAQGVVNVGMVTFAAVCAGFAAAPALAQVSTAQTARDLLTKASFIDDDRTAALARVTEAQAAAGAALRRSPHDMEASLMQAMALGYVAKLTGGRAEAIAARKQFEVLVARDPRNADAQMALGAWHIGGVNRLGGFVGRTVLGAQKKTGFDALDRSVALGGGHALYPGIAALLHLEMDPTDPRGRALAEVASRGSTATVLDRLMQRSAAAVLVSIRAGHTAETKALASRLLPFGRLDL